MVVVLFWCHESPLFQKYSLSRLNVFQVLSGQAPGSRSSLGEALLGRKEGSYSCHGHCDVFGARCRGSCVHLPLEGVPAHDSA